MPQCRTLNGMWVGRTPTWNQIGVCVKKFGQELRPTFITRSSPSRRLEQDWISTCLTSTDICIFASPLISAEQLSCEHYLQYICRTVIWISFASFNLLCHLIDLCCISKSVKCQYFGMSATSCPASLMKYSIRKVSEEFA